MRAPPTAGLDRTGQNKRGETGCQPVPRSQALSQLFLRSEKRDDDREHKKCSSLFLLLFSIPPPHTHTHFSSCPNFCFSVFHTRVTLVAEEILLSISFCQWQISIASSPWYKDNPTPSFGTCVQMSPQVSLAHRPQLCYWED